MAQWDPNGGLDLITEEADSFTGYDLEPSVWVRRMIKSFDKFVGFSIDPSERQCISFFKQLEKVWERQAAAGSLCRTFSLPKKGIRELRNLVSTINYDEQSGRRTRGNVNSIGMGSDRCP